MPRQSTPRQPALTKEQKDYVDALVHLDKASASNTALIDVLAEEWDRPTELIKVSLPDCSTFLDGKTESEQSLDGNDEDRGKGAYCCAKKGSRSQDNE